MAVFKLLLISCFISTVSNSVRFPNCKITPVFAKVCTYWNYKDTCTPWNLETCKKIKTTQFDSKCPKYTCVSI